MRPILFAIPLLLAALPGCRGKVVTKAHLRGPGSVETRFKYEKPVKLWAELDGVWNGPSKSTLPATYDITVTQGGKQVARLSCNTEHSGGVKICGSESSVMGEHEASCEVSLDCGMPNLSKGDVMLNVTGRIDPHRVKKIRNMSILVRDD
jgi:hypothetical protein